MWVSLFHRLLVVGSTCLIAACSGTGQPSPPSFTGIDCSSYGGCDVLEDYTDGSSTIIPLRASMFLEADMRARQDAKLANVRDAEVVGHDPPHVGLSNLYFRTPPPS